MSEGVRGDHDTARCSVVLPPAAVALGAEDVGECRELEQPLLAIWELLSEEDVFALSHDGVIGDRLDLHTELQQSAGDFLEAVIRLFVDQTWAHENQQE